MIKKIVFKMSYILLVLIFMILFFNVKDNYIDDENKNEIKEEVSSVLIPDKRVQLSEMKQINEDVEAWIYIPGTTIDWPIMRWVSDGDDETSFYHRRNEYKKYAFEGSIYSSAGVIFSPFLNLSNNLIIYGHNLDDNPSGKKFAQLMKFRDIEFAKNTPYIFITTSDKQLVYQIYAAFFTDINFECYWIGLDEYKQKEMIDGARERSEYIYDVDVSGRDKIITLSTCTYKYGKYQSVSQKNTRFIVQGKLLENINNLSSQVSLIKNPNPKAPDIPKS